MLIVRTCEMCRSLVFEAKCYGDLSSSYEIFMPWGHTVRVCFSPLFMLVPSLPLKTVLLVCPNLASALPTLFTVTSSLYLAVGSLFWQSLVHFLGYVHWYECYLAVSMGWGEIRIFLLFHLPWKCETVSILIES